MTSALRKAGAWLLTGLVCFYVLWLVIANNITVSLNLLFAQTPALNVGLVICLSFLAGLLIGALMSLLYCRIRPRA